MNKIYFGFGSRNTPTEVLAIMSMLGEELEEKGFIQRNGGAHGADESFLTNIKDPNTVELYIPWQGYNNYETSMPMAGIGAYELAFTNHPNWKACSEVVRKLHARNSQLVMGADNHTPALFGIGWTPDAATVGGSGQTIRVAEFCNVPVFNLARGEEELDKLIAFVESI